MARTAANTIGSTVAVASVVAFVFGCSSASTDKADSGQEYSPSTNLTWRPCGTGLQNLPIECTDIQVPLDWSQPDGDKITIALGRQPASGDRRGSMVNLPGGPGVSGLDFLRGSVGPWKFPDGFRRAFDLVSFDPRGVGASRPAVQCPPDPVGVVQPRSAAEFDALVQRNKTYFESCRGSTGPLWDHLDAVSTARDVDAIRIALGEPKLTGYGGSYGSLYGSAYLETFPDGARAMILDGVVDHSADLVSFASNVGQALEVSFNRFVAWCNQDTRCALHGTDINALYDRLIARAPLPAPGAYRPATADDLRETLRGQLSGGWIPDSDLGWPTLARMLKQADAGDASELVGPADTHANGNLRGVMCTDFPVPTDFVESNQAAQQARTAAPRFGEATFWDLVGGCTGWSRPPVNPPHLLRIAGTPMVQVVNPFYDPSTPLVQALAVASQIPNSGLLIADADGHEAQPRSQCAMDATVAFVTEPSSSPRFITCPN